MGVIKGDTRSLDYRSFWLPQYPVSFKALGYPGLEGLGASLMPSLQERPAIYTP